MTLDYVKNYDFGQQMSNQKIANFASRLKNSPEEDFVNIVLYFLDEHIEGVKNLETNPGTNPNVVKILKHKSTKEKIVEYFGTEDQWENSKYLKIQIP
jgi:hypothetical protein